MSESKTLEERLVDAIRTNDYEPLLLEYLDENESALEGIVDDAYVSDSAFSIDKKHCLEHGEVTTRVQVAYTHTVTGQCCDMPQSERRTLTIEVVQYLYSAAIELEAAMPHPKPDGDYY